MYAVVYMPYNFLYNFGISFSNYLRGAANTVSVLNEFLADLVTAVTLFFRFFIQGVRLLLILFTYVSLHDL